MCILSVYFEGKSLQIYIYFNLINKSITREFYEGELKEIGIM